MYRVMVVEDEMLVRAGIISFINWAEHQMKVSYEAQNGQIAWDMYLKRRPDFILTDIKMPVMDGLEFIDKVRGVDKDTPIVILTCLEEFELLHRAVRMGVADYILKHSMDHSVINTLLCKIKNSLDARNIKGIVTNDYTENYVAQKTFLHNYLFENSYDDAQFYHLFAKIFPNDYEQYLSGCFMSITKHVDNHYERSIKSSVPASGGIERAGTQSGQASVITGQEGSEGLTVESGGAMDDDSWGSIKSSVEKIIQASTTGSDSFFCFPLNKTDYLLLFCNLTPGNIKSMHNVLLRIKNMLEAYLSIRAIMQIGEVSLDLASIKREVLKRLSGSGNETSGIVQEGGSKYINGAMHFISLYYHRPINLNEIAEYVGYSPNYLCSIFKKETGIGISDFINRARIEKSKELLTNTLMKNYEIAEAVGYGSESYFSRIFKQLTNQTPNNFRRTNNGVIK